MKLLQLILVYFSHPLDSPIMASVTSNIAGPRGILTENAEVPTATVSCIKLNLTASDKVLVTLGHFLLIKMYNTRGVQNSKHEKWASAYHSIERSAADGLGIPEQCSALGSNVAPCSSTRQITPRRSKKVMWMQWLIGIWILCKKNAYTILLVENE